MRSKGSHLLDNICARRCSFVVPDGAVNTVAVYIDGARNVLNADVEGGFCPSGDEAAALWPVATLRGAVEDASSV